MKRLPWLFLAVAFSALGAENKPNIVVILADDLGYGDVSCYHPQSRIPTPHLDRLAAAGVRFTDAHSPSAVCTPTRYGLLTGRYCWRTRLERGVLDGFDPPLIEPGRATLASFLRENGYATACVGKWHLGMTWTDRQGKPVPWRGEGFAGFRGEVGADFARDTEGGPLDRGFDSWFGISASLDMPPYVYLEGRRATAAHAGSTPESKSLFLNQSPGPIAGGFALEKVLGDLARRAVEFVESRAGQEQPFFLYLPLTSPHLPVTPAGEWLGRSGIGEYGDFVMETDARVGEVLASLDRAGVTDDTLVIFTSDNGGLWHAWEARETDDVKGYRPTPRAQFNAERGHHSNAGLRGTKADIWEGGHRVPFLVRWPAKVGAGATSDALVELNDLFATVAEILGTLMPEDAAEDSLSFLPALGGGPGTRDFAVHHSLRGVFALREGPWKFIEARGSGGFSHPRTVVPAPGEPETQLYRLDKDPAETQNLAGRETAVAGRLAARLAEIRRSTRTRP